MFMEHYFLGGAANIAALQPPVATSYLGPISNNTLLGTALLNGSAEQTTIHTARVPGGMVDIQLAFCGAYMGTLASGNIAEINVASYTVYASVEYPVGSGSFTTIASNMTVASGGITLSPKVSVAVPNGANFKLWVYASGTQLPVLNTNNIAKLNSADERLNTASATTTPKQNPTQTDGTWATRLCVVGAILGTTSGDTLALVGDSQVAFLSSTYTVTDGTFTSHNRGDIAETLGGDYAYINLGVGGDQWETALFSFGMRQALATYASTAILEFGINSFLNKGQSAATTPLQLIQRALPFFKGKKIIATTTTPNTTSTGNTTASFTGTVSGSVLTVAAISSGTILVGMSINSASGPTIASLGTGTGGVGTYNLNVGSSGTPTTATGAFISATGADQTVKSYSTVLSGAYKTGLNGLGGYLPAPLDRYTPLQSSTADKWEGAGTKAYDGTPDGTHVGRGGVTLMTVQKATWEAQLAALTPVTPTQPATDFATSGATYAGGYATAGTFTRNDVMPGNGVFTFVMRVKTSSTSGATPFTNNFSSYIKNIQIGSGAGTGFVTLTLVGGTAIGPGTISVTDGADHEIAVSVNASGNAYLFVDGVLQGSSLGNVWAGSARGDIALAATSTCNIREVTVWNVAKWTANYTPALFAGTEAGCITRWPMATNAVGVLGPVLPQ